MEYLLLASLWMVWCTVHSGMISVTATNCLKRRFGDQFRWYRLLFNLIALLTLIPIYLYGRSIDGPVLFRWEGILGVIRWILLGAAVLLFIAGARRYDMLQFVGLRQIATGSSHGALTESGRVHTTGVQGITRHPWYLGAMVFVWTAGRTIDVPALVTNSILTGYLILGTVLEERKLVIEFGDDYRKYQRQVDMLFPVRFLVPGLRQPRK